MKKNFILFALAALLLPFNLLSAPLSNNQPIELPKRFVVGDQYYTSSYRGIKQLMGDIREENPVLYDIMQPELKNIQRRRSNTIIAWSAGGVVGTTMIVGGLTFWQLNDDLYEPGHPFYKPNAKKANPGLIIAGGLVYIVGGAIGLFTGPREEDIYNFVNKYNRNSEDKKMDWQIGLDVLPNNTPGVKLTFNL